MKFDIFITIAKYILMVTIVFCPLKTNASDIIGDVNNNGTVNLEEAIHALQVAAGMKPATVLDPDSGPRRAAWGTYTYAANILTAAFAFSTFVDRGPTIDTFELQVESISSTTAIFRNPSNEQEIWTREPGNPGDIVGRWEQTDPDNNTYTLILDSNGSMLYTARGDSFLEVVHVPTKTITIDGNFADWGGTSLNLYNSTSDCSGDAGKTITGVSVAQDDNNIYVKMTLNGPPDVTFRYKFGQMVHIRVVPPPFSSCGLASPVGGENSGTAAFGTGSSEDPPDNRHILECRVDKCLVTAWRANGGFHVWSDQDNPSVCRSRSNLPNIVFDFSTCD